jgi:spore germination cell wall hydrolase CwlJ-like protein
MMLEAWVVCMALNIHFEAAGEPIDGQFMVAMATWTRAKGKKENVCAEVYRPAAFSWTAKYPPVPKEDSPAFRHAIKVAQLSIHMRDFTDGVDHYHTFQVSPAWARSPKLEVAGSIGNHIMYRPRVTKVK